jgi:hypothetical protein
MAVLIVGQKNQVSRKGVVRKDIAGQLVELGLAKKTPDQNTSKQIIKKFQTTCRICKSIMHKDRLANHLKEMHGVFSERELVKCEVCGVEVNKKNLAKHNNKVHLLAKNKKNKRHQAKVNKIVAASISSIGAAKTNKPEFSSPQKRKCKRQLSPKEAAARRAALKDQNIQSNAIKAYLRRVPSKPTMGKFGVPQSKYRYNFYGHKTFCYDNWGRS